MLESRARACLVASANPIVNSRHVSHATLGLPPPAQARVALAYAQAALEEARAHGLAPRDLGLPQPLPDPLPALRYMAALEQAARLGDIDDFGLRVGARMRTATFVAYGQVLLSCPDFGTAVLQTRRFEGLAHDLGRSELQVDGEVATYRWHCPWLDRQPGRHTCESVMAGIMAFGSWLAQRRLPLRSLAFPHPPPKPSTRARLDDAFGVGVRFDASCTEARFDAALLAEPIPSADPSLLPVLQGHAASLMAAREAAVRAAAGEAGSELAQAVRVWIARRLAHDGARVDEVARELGCSGRTLQRRLAQAGTPFQVLLESVRRELAGHYLRDPALSLTEVAFLLGYAEHSSFTHAYRSWFGCSPQQARQRQRGG